MLFVKRNNRLQYFICLFIDFKSGFMDSWIRIQDSGRGLSIILLWPGNWSLATEDQNKSITIGALHNVPSNGLGSVCGHWDWVKMWTLSWHNVCHDSSFLYWALHPWCPGEIPAQLWLQVPSENLPANPRPGRGEQDRIAGWSDRWEVTRAG